MSRFLIRRAAASLLLLFLVLTATFLLMHTAPGGPESLVKDPRISAATREAFRRAYGLDRPVLTQYVIWLKAVIWDQNWGTSIARGIPVLAVIGRALPNTLLLASAAACIQWGLGLLLGIAAATRRGGLLDHFVRLVSLTLYSLPTFWLALVAILFLCHTWPVFPPSHPASVGADLMPLSARILDRLWHLALPALVLGSSTAGGIARFVRNGLLDSFNRDFVTALLAKGCTVRRVVWVHSIRYAAAPWVQILGLSIPFLLSGALIVEVIFSWPGIGRVAYEAVLSRDYPLILGTTAMAGIAVVAGSLVADILHAFLDPRVRHG